MKKLSVIVLLIVTFYSCAKKITSAKVVAKPSANKEVVADSAKEDKRVTSEIAPTASLSVDAISAETPEDFKRKDLVVEGKKIFEIKCSRCHELIEPANYNADKWIKIVDWMGPRAKIDATEKESILAYVSFYAKK